MHLHFLQSVKLFFDCSGCNPRYFPIEANIDLYVLFDGSKNCIQQDFREFVVTENNK